MTQQFDSLNEKTKLIDISLKYTGGDIEKAKAMAAGQLDDIKVIKCKFLNPESLESGMLLVFVNVVDEYISKIVTVLSFNESIFERMRIFDNWKSLYNDSVAFKQGSDILESDDFTEHLMGSLISADIFVEVLDGDLAGLIRKINEGIRGHFNTDNIQCQVELDVTNSLAMDLIGILIDVPDTGGDDESSGDTIEAVAETDEDRRIREIEEQVNYIVKGAVIVSPVSGKYVNNIEIGELIKVILSGTDAVTRKLIEVLKATKDDGSLAPVNGRLKAKIPLEKSGYILYALVAKGVLAKIIEEENVKIQIDTSVKQEIEKTKMDNKVLYILAILVGLVIISGFILFNIL